METNTIPAQTATAPSIEDGLRDILVEALFVERPRDQILSTTSLRQELGLDSVGFVELKTQVETRFRVTISDDAFAPENFASISTLAGLIERLPKK